MTGGAADPSPRQVTQHATQTGDGILVQVQGGGVVNVDRVGLTLSRFRTRRVTATDPLALLHPHACAVPLVGRDAALADLREWADAARPVGARPIRARLLLGAAGIGKTRLALELCDRLADAGWHAGFLTETEMARFADARNAGTWDWPQPTLVAVDDAGAVLPRLRRWLVELAANPTATSLPLRLLLLERHADADTGWWRELVGAGDAEADAVRALFDPPEPVVLAPLEDVADRRALFAATLARLDAAHLLPAPDPSFDRHFGAVEWGGEPLWLMIAATAAAEAGVGTALGLGRADAALKVADVEIARIRRFARDEAAGPLLAHLAAVVTLCGGLARTDGLRVVAAERAALHRDGLGDVRSLYDDLRRALPDPASSGAVAPVRPDRIGAALALRALGEGDRDDALAAVGRAAAGAWEPTAAVVAVVARDYAETPSLRGAPLAWLDALVEAAGSDRHRLAALVAALPWHTAHLRGRATAITLRLVDAMCADPTTPPATLARRLSDLSTRLASVGRGEAALVAAADAAAIWQRAGALDDIARLDHAIALTNLASHLDAAGRAADALVVDEEAVATMRALAPTDLVRVKLAGALANRAARLVRAEDAGLALPASLEAVAAARDAAALRPLNERPTLASALCTRSRALERSGQPDAALPPVDEAVAILRGIGAEHPTAYDAALAQALNARSNCLLACGRAGEALLAIEEAVRTLAPLFLADPPAFAREMLGIAGNYRRQTDALAHPVDAALIEPIEEALVRLQRG